MKLNSKLAAINTILSAGIFRKRVPLAIRWQLTNKCTSKCKYCKIWNSVSAELTTTQIFSLLNEVKEMGTQRISFSGGNPLLRKDIGAILEHCKRIGISTGMNSDGFLVPQKIKELATLDLLKLSLDGPEDIHDLTRGKGSYKRVIEAAEVARDNHIKFTFATTLTRYNIRHLGFILKVAERFNTVVAFQPLKRLYRGVDDISSLYPSSSDFKHEIDRLIAVKRTGNRHIRNSLVGLRHIYNWPRYENLKCGAGIIFCIIETNGEVKPCDRIKYAAKLPNCLEIGFKRAFDSLPDIRCNGCGFCGALELNYLLSFNLSIIKDMRGLL